MFFLGTYQGISGPITLSVFFLECTLKHRTALKYQTHSVRSPTFTRPETTSTVGSHDVRQGANLSQTIPSPLTTRALTTQTLPPTSEHRETLHSERAARSVGPVTGETSFPPSVRRDPRFFITLANRQLASYMASISTPSFEMSRGWGAMVPGHLFLLRPQLTSRQVMLECLAPGQMAIPLYTTPSFPGVQAWSKNSLVSCINSGKSCYF